MKITKDYLIRINQSYVYITNEPFGYNSNLDFIVTEYNDSKQQKNDIAKIVFRILITHPFVQGNKRTSFAILDSFENIRNTGKVKTAILKIVNNPEMDQKEGIKLILESLR